MCSLTIECVLLLFGTAHSGDVLPVQVRAVHRCVFNHFEFPRRGLQPAGALRGGVSDYRMCSVTMDCVLLRWNVFSYDYRMCSLTQDHASVGKSCSRRRCRPKGLGFRILGLGFGV
jgi:hypothetical protein